MCAVFGGRRGSRACGVARRRRRRIRRGSWGLIDFVARRAGGSKGEEEGHVFKDLTEEGEGVGLAHKRMLRGDVKETSLGFRGGRIGTDRAIHDKTICLLCEKEPVKVVSVAVGKGTKVFVGELTCQDHRFEITKELIAVFVVDVSRKQPKAKDMEIKTLVKDVEMLIVFVLWGKIVDDFHRIDNVW